METNVDLANGVELRTIPISPNDDYMAGSDGKIYSRTRYKGFGKKVYVDWYALRGCVAKKGNGYLTVSLCHNNKKVTKSVHRLVCMVFHGMPSPTTLQVRHLNGDATDNQPSNLQWGTQEENWMDREAHGHGIRGEKHHNAKFTDKEREHIRWCVKMGLCSQSRAARILGVKQASVFGIVNSDH